MGEVVRDETLSARPPTPSTRCPRRPWTRPRARLEAAGGVADRRLLRTGNFESDRHALPVGRRLSDRRGDAARVGRWSSSGCRAASVRPFLRRARRLSASTARRWPAEPADGLGRATTSITAELSRARGGADSTLEPARVGRVSDKQNEARLAVRSRPKLDYGKSSAPASGRRGATLSEVEQGQATKNDPDQRARSPPSTRRTTAINCVCARPTAAKS